MRTWLRSSGWNIDEFCVWWIIPDEVMEVRNAPIGVMDSGVGGLTVVSEIWRQLPTEAVLFYGDSARCPYGDREPDEIARFTFYALDYLVEQGVKMLVIACNTATAVCLERARERYAVPVVGVISPGARAAIAASSTQRVGVIGTSATVRSQSYPRALRAAHRGIRTWSVACPRFVEIVERGEADAPSTQAVVEEALRPLLNADIDTLILGCTHYPHLAGVIARAMGPRVTLINSAEETARDVSLWLTENRMTRIALREPEHVFLTSGDPSQFARVGQSWLGCPLDVRYLDVLADEERGAGGM